MAVHDGPLEWPRLPADNRLPIHDMHVRCEPAVGLAPLRSRHQSDERALLGRRLHWDAAKALRRSPRERVDRVRSQPDSRGTRGGPSRLGESDGARCQSRRANAWLSQAGRASADIWGGAAWCCHALRNRLRPKLDRLRNELSARTCAERKLQREPLDYGWRCGGARGAGNAQRGRRRRRRSGLLCPERQPLSRE